MAATCAFHQDRPGRAVCMACRRVVCEECSTEWEGIHYCPPCLARRGRQAVPRRKAPAVLLLLLGSTLLLFVNAHLWVWGGLMLAEILR